MVATTNSGYSDDDGGFEFYEVTTTDPGPAMLVGTILISILLYAMLPFMVACGERRDRKRRAWEYKNRVEQKPSSTDGAGTGGDDGTDNQPARESIMKNGVQLRQKKNSLAEKEPGMEGIRHSDSWAPESIAESTHDTCSRARIHSDIWETISIASSTSHISWAPKFVNDVIVNAHLAGGHGLQRNRLLMRAKELEQQEQEEDARAGGVNADGISSNSGSSSGRSTTSSSNSDTESSTDKAQDGNDSKLADTKVAPYVGDTDALKIPIPPPPSSTVVSTWYALLEVADWEKENKRVMNLALPYLTQAFLSGVAKAAVIAIIGKYYGTRSLSAYVVIEMTVGLTTEFFGGIKDATGILATHSIGAGTTMLTGQYFQIGFILYFLIVTPFTVAWVFAVEDLLAFFGFDDETVDIGFNFTKVYVWYTVIRGMDQCMNAFLDISDHEMYSTITTSCRELSVALALMLLPLLASVPPTLQEGGYCMLAVTIVYLIWNVIFVAWQGWWRKYYSGMVYSFAPSNRTATRSIMSTSIPLSFGYLLAYGEWELLTVFAKFLGPAEVAAWGILGSVWDVLEGSTEAIAEAGEVVSAFYLGAGKPQQAKMSAYKSLLLAFVISVLLTSIVFMCAEDLAYWMTDDLVLQQLVIELIPLFGVGNIALAIGSMAWTLVGAQGRYALSTSIGFAGSWCVTVPLSALFSIALNFNLKGQTAAVVIGYMVSGTWNTYILLVSDWQGISEKVIAYNAANDVKLDSDLESDDDDDSDSSSSSSDARGKQGRNQRESRRDAGEESGGESGGETSLSSAPTPSTATH